MFKKVKQNYIFLVVFLSIWVVFSGCGKDHFTMDDFGDVIKIDAHLHINSENSAFIEQAIEDNFRLLTINVDYPDFPPVEEQLKITIGHLNSYPDRVAFASTFKMAGWDNTGWQEKTIQHLDSTFDQGAIAVKVWKNIGMEFKDKNGNLVMIDDPKFDPIFSHLYKKDIRLIGHMGEPKDCWMPIEEMMVNGDREYFKNHPQYYMYLHPEMPSYEEQMQARDRMLERNPDLKFMGAHLASLEWSVDEIGKFLDRFPNAVVDLAARMGQVQYQSSRDREKVRQFFTKYQDRVLYATDLTQEPDADPIEFKKAVHETWLSDWKYFNTDSTLTVPELNDPFQGLALPKRVVEKIYRINAKKAFPTAWKHRNL